MGRPTGWGLPLAGSIAGTPTIAGLVGIGQAYNPAGAHLDPLTGTIIGVAIYDDALTAEEIAAHAQAYVIPEPASLLVGSVAGVNELAAEPSFEFLDSQHKGRDFNGQSWGRFHSFHA